MAKLPEQELTAKRLLADTLCIPDVCDNFIGQIFEEIERKVPSDVSHFDRVILSGSGDLHHAALGSQWAFEVLSGLPTLVLPSMTFGLYHSSSVDQKSLIIQMSFSGKTARSVEAGHLASANGAEVWSLTCIENSPLALASRLTLVKPDTGDNEAAGYPITLVMLFALAIVLGKRRLRRSVLESRNFQEALRLIPQSMRETIERTAGASSHLAEKYAGAGHYLFLGSGPSFGAATNGSARILEAIGGTTHAMDIEEWVHLDRWCRDRLSPAILICPNDRSRNRSQEVLSAMNFLSRANIAVVAEDDNLLRDLAQDSLNVSYRGPEMFSPLVYSIPGELFAHNLSAIMGVPPFMGDDEKLGELGELRWGGSMQSSLSSL